MELLRLLRCDSARPSFSTRLTRWLAITRTHSAVENLRRDCAPTGPLILFWLLGAPWAGANIFAPRNDPRETIGALDGPRRLTRRITGLPGCGQYARRVP